jgi:uncharacterized protein
MSPDPSGDPIAAWRAFLASPAAPATALSPLELDGYLTAIVVAPQPDPIRPSLWMPGIWGDADPVFDDIEQANRVLGMVMVHHNAIIGALDRSLDRLHAADASDYRPLFVQGVDKPSLDDVRLWANGFWKAMRLAPDAWTMLAEDKRTQPLLGILSGFVALDDPEFVPADNIDELLDEGAALIPRVITVLHKISLERAREHVTARPVRAPKIGRNDPCPCGSGQKYKRCCGRN